MSAPAELSSLTVSALLELVRRREIQAREIWQACLERSRRLDPTLHAFLHLEADPPGLDGDGNGGRNRGRGAEAPVADPLAGGVPGLGGVPCALKDNIVARGMPCTCGSRILEGYRPPYDATVTARLRLAGAVVLGKTNMDEFAMGSSTEHSAFGPCRNPWRLDRVPGGSSGGSAAAVSADLVPFALGSDTGGSVRQPAAFCGVVGLKPTYGLVSRYGLVAFASSLDQIGPLTKDVTDCALVLSAIAGHDPLDSTSVEAPPRDYRRCLVPEVKGLKLGLPREYLGGGVEDGTRRAIERAVALFSELGARVEECSLPHTEYALDTYYILAPAEASSNLARYDGVRYGYRAAGDDAPDLGEMYSRTRSEGFGAEVKRRIMIGTYVLSAGYYEAYYLKAQKVRTLIKQDFERAFERFDALVTPTAPSVAFGLGARMEDPLQMYMADVCTLPANLAGLPGLSLPCGFDGGLPVGMQLLGPLMGEPVLLRLAFAFESASGIRNPKPGEVTR